MNAIALSFPFSAEWTLPWRTMPPVESQTTVLSTRWSAPPWFATIKARLEELSLLPENWDGRGSRRVSGLDADDVLNFLWRAMEIDFPAPWIGPLSSGGLQVSWGAGDLEVEGIFDRSRGERVLLASDGGIDREVPIDDLDQAVSELSVRVRALAAAPA